MMFLALLLLYTVKYMLLVVVARKDSRKFASQLKIYWGNSARFTRVEGNVLGQK
jgi:hypothetical protein